MFSLRIDASGMARRLLSYFKNNQRRENARRSLLRRAGVARCAGSGGCRTQIPYDRPKQPRTHPITDVLVIGGRDGVTTCLRSLFRRARWSIATTDDCAAAIGFLNENRAAVAICDDHLRDGSWQDIAAAFEAIPDAPALIVVAEDAGDVIARGGFDVLARPLIPKDVIWSVASAWHEWWKRQEAGFNKEGPCLET